MPYQTDDREKWVAYLESVFHLSLLISFRGTQSEHRQLQFPRATSLNPLERIERQSCRCILWLEDTNLFYSIFHYVPKDIYRLLLSQSMGTPNCLEFHHRIPLRFDQVDPVRHGEIKT